MHPAVGQDGFMLQLLIVIVRGLALALRGHRELVLENVALLPATSGDATCPETSPAKDM